MSKSSSTFESEFKTPQGVWRTGELFLETNQDFEGEHKQAIYTLYDEDREYNGKIYSSCKKLYLAIGDPTEYEQVKELFGSLAHWVKLCECKSLKVHIQAWREELELKVKSTAIKNMISLSKGINGGPQARWLAECGWKGPKRGRPTKEEIDGALEKSKKEKENLKDYASRLDLVPEEIISNAEAA